jgi:hypothetical protein
MRTNSASENRPLLTVYRWFFVLSAIIFAMTFFFSRASRRDSIDELFDPNVIGFDLSGLPQAMADLAKRDALTLELGKAITELNKLLKQCADDRAELQRLYDRVAQVGIQRALATGKAEASVRQVDNTNAAHSEFLGTLGFPKTIDDLSGMIDEAARQRREFLAAPSAGPPDEQNVLTSIRNDDATLETVRVNPGDIDEVLLTQLLLSASNLGWPV